jgi:hypothetical protein
MASLISTALTRLLPGGLAWSLTGQALQVKDALADSVETVREFCDEAQAESIPATATGTIQDWHLMLGFDFDPGQTIEQQRARIVTAHTSIGGSSLAYLQGQVSRQFPLVSVTELPAGGPFGFAYEVKGAVQTLRDYNRLQGLIQRIFPLHLEPQYGVQILASLDTAYTGIAMCGRAISGRITA